MASGQEESQSGSCRIGPLLVKSIGSSCMETSSSSPIFVHPIAAMIDAISDIETLSIAPFRY